MRVLLISNVTGGLYLFRRELIETLCREHEVFAIGADTGHVSDLELLGCKIIIVNSELKGKNPTKELYLLKTYEKIINRIKPDIVFTYTIKPNVYGGMICSKHDIPYVVNVTGLGNAIESDNKFLKTIALFLYKKSLKNAQKVFFQNQSNYEYITVEKKIKCKADLLPGSGVNLDRFKVLEYPNEDVINFVFISRITKRKGIELYLSAAEIIKEKYPFTRFHVYGDCDIGYEKLIRTYQNKGIIEYHGYVDDVISIHRRSSCTIHPSYYPEGMANVLLESCACGRPAITTDRPGCGDIVDDGVNGFIVLEKDLHSLECAIEKFINLSWNEKKQMGIMGRKKVEKFFSRDIVIQKYISEINSIRELKEE